MSQAFDTQMPFWQSVIGVKRDIKRLRKELKRKENLLHTYMQNVLDAFEVSPDISEN